MSVPRAREGTFVLMCRPRAGGFRGGSGWRFFARVRLAIPWVSAVMWRFFAKVIPNRVFGNPQHPRDAAITLALDSLRQPCEAGRCYALGAADMPSPGDAFPFSNVAACSILRL